MTDAVMTIAGLLADDTPRDTGPDFGKASPLGLVIVVILLIATFLLVWSMNNRLKNLPESFDPESPEPDQAADDGTVGLPRGASEPTGNIGDPDGSDPHERRG